MRAHGYLPFLLITAFACQPAQPPDTSAAAKQAIDAANSQWPRLTSTGHADSIAEFYAGGPRVLRDHENDGPAPDSHPPCRDSGGQWTGRR